MILSDENSFIFTVCEGVCKFHSSQLHWSVARRGARRSSTRLLW